ncbi:MAG: glycosyltransferase family 39 protein [Candidatus Auribacterota bacterium]|nr:glycosyltransferase family 39 protein [Candidatus Auribacterota bacterium]
MTVDSLKRLFCRQSYTSWLSWILVVSYVAPWIVLYFMYSWALLFYPYEWEPGEGSKILYALHIVRGLPLYSSNQTFPMLGNCYPPLYPLTLAPFVALGGPLLIWGRLVSLLAIIGTLILLFCIARRSTGSSFFGLISAGCFVYPASISCWYSLARMDSLCCFLQILTAYIIVRSKSIHGAILAGVTAILAIYTKQTAVIVITPLACYYIFQKNWKNTAVYFLTIGVIGSGIYIMMEHITYGWFHKNLFDENVHRLFFWFRYKIFFGWFFRQNLPVLIAASISLIFFLKKRKNIISIWIFLGGFANAILIAANGSGMNYFFVLWAGVSLLFAESFSILANRMVNRLKFSSYTCSCILIGLMISLQLINYAFLPNEIFYRHTLYDFIPTENDLRSCQRLEAYIRVSASPIFVDRFPSIAIRHGKNDYYVEPALIQELYYAGKWDPLPLVKQVEKKNFATIFMLHQSLMPKPFKDAVAENYRLVAEIPVGTFEIWRRRSIFVLEPK